MTKLAKVLAGATLSLALTAGSAMAFPATPENGYHWVNAPFWTNTDFTTSQNGTAMFQVTFENFARNRDANFGIFTVADTTQPSDPKLFQIFAAKDEVTPFPQTTLSFKQDGAKYYVTLDNAADQSTWKWTEFSNIFGFYFQQVDTANSDILYQYFTASSLDTVGTSTAGNPDLNIATATDNNHNVLIYYDNLNDGTIQMNVYGNDLAPVPEPGTMMLLGAGFLGLAVYGKRRKNA